MSQDSKRMQEVHVGLGILIKITELVELGFRTKIKWLFLCRGWMKCPKCPAQRRERE